LGEANLKGEYTVAEIIVSLKV